MRLRELKGNVELHQPVHEGSLPPGGRRATGSLNEPLISSQSFDGRDYGIMERCFPTTGDQTTLQHYDNLTTCVCIMMYGPPGGMWTARYESKHRVGKSLAQAGKNFISITKTLSERQQFREASIYYSGMT